MAYGSINIKLRPVKLAFLIEPNNKTSLLKAIEINTFLWGGMFNPIIPAFKRIPKVWKKDQFENLNIKKIINGYLDAFDPDFIVKVGEFDISHVNIGVCPKVTGKS